MARLSPEALARIAEALPDTYDDNPDQFLSDYNGWQGAREEVERLRPIGSWYEREYQPWYKTYGGDFKEFQDWKERGSTPAADPATTASTPTPSSTSHAGTDSLRIDFDGMDATRQVFDHVNRRIDDAVSQANARFGLVEQQVQQKAEELMRLAALQEQANGLFLEATWHKIDPSGWRPDLDIQKVVSYAQQHNIPDVRQAYMAMTQGDREKAMMEAARKEGREEAMREMAGRQVTTEMTTGTPMPRHQLQPDRPRGYGLTGQEQIMANARQRAIDREAGRAA